MPGRTSTRVRHRLRALWRDKRPRLLLTLQLAVMLPAAALIYINFYHLKSVQRDKVLEAAIHRDFQQMLAIAEKQINRNAYAMAEAARALFPGPDVADPSRQLAMLDAVLLQRPWLADAFLFDQEHGLLLRSQPRRMEEPAFAREHQRFGRWLGTWLATESGSFLDGMRTKGKSIAWFTERTDGEAGADYYTTAYFSLPGPSANRSMLGGVRFDSTYLKQTFFPTQFEELISSKFAEESASPLAMSVSAAQSAHRAPSAPAADWVLAASSGWQPGKAEVSRNLDDAFRGLALGIKFQGTSVEALGRNWAYRSFLILGVLSLLLIGGLGLTYHSIHKELALARLKSDFVSNVSHDLRTPLALIRLYAETLELGRVPSPEREQTYHRTIRIESERLTALIDNILDFSRLEAGRKEYEFRPTDLAELVSATLASYRAQIDELGFDFDVSIDSGLPLVSVDRDAIARSLVNLVTNALKYSDRERFLRVRLYETGGVIKLEVADHGIGIARSEQSKIFEKFYRTGDPLVHTTKGSGLGLSLVRHVAHAHGGEVSVDSTVGRGSTFTLSLPVAVPSPEHADHAA